MEIEAPSALSPGITPPQRIALGDLVVRRWEPLDLLPRFAALTASFEHLHSWMEWAAEPITLEQQREFGAAMAASWPSASGSFNYGIFDRAEAVLGAIGIHDRVGPRTLEIGYWCHVDHTGRGVITRSAAELTRIALALPGVDRVEIHCDAANTRSAAVAQRLGYRLERIAPRPKLAPAESGQGMWWVKTAE
ncbi:GNAT family N-acetyltransferase [Nocardia sp. NPDC020380]|uniref:GNAT family N-acetyltransferase n=1 Tax=Nocardia sp. NPDC020380 TaxID=3364309 RepID=UPI0037B7E7FD